MGTFKPTDPNKLAQLLGQSVNGTWTLQLTDTATGVVGTLNGWSLAITPAAVTSSVSTSITIPAPPAALSSPLTITGRAGSTVGNVSVVLNVTDTSLAYLSAVLVAPDGKTKVTLFNAGSLTGAN